LLINHRSPLLFANAGSAGRRRNHDGKKEEIILNIDDATFRCAGCGQSFDCDSIPASDDGWKCLVCLGRPPSLTERIAVAIRKVPLSISSTRRSGDNGLRNANELAQVALAACQAEEMLKWLRQIASFPDATPISDAHYVVRKHSRELLAKIDGKP
jgi:hypothetical protein